MACETEREVEDIGGVKAWPAQVIGSHGRTSLLIDHDHVNTLGLGRLVHRAQRNI
jgi:hypothetical protein